MSHPIDLYDVRNGVLEVGGVPLDRLAERVGTTPFFAYDRSLITRRVGELRAALPQDLQLSYAIKANPMPAVVQHLYGLVDSFDVASVDEMRVALDTPITPDHVSFAGPGKRSTELRSAIAAGITVEIESPTEADRLVMIGAELGIRPRAAVRINPDFQLKGSGMRMGGGPQQFGTDAEAVPALLRSLADRDIDVVGFHVFAGSQNLHAESLCDAQHKGAELVLQMSEHLDGEASYVNLGGGFGIPYSSRDQPLDLAVVGENLMKVLDKRLRPALPHARVVIELGRYIVGEAGVYVTRVVDRKASRGKEYAVVDGGLHHQLAASGNFGQVLRRNYPIAAGLRMGDEPAGELNLVGCLCTPLDLLGSDVALPPIDINDLVVIFQAGAYGLTASPTAFLSHPAPVEVLV